MLRSLIEQRAACAGVSAFLSSAVEVYPHQVRAALTVLSDPIQRYLLADEVGLGKTIEAGFVVRQTLLDNPRARIAVITPDVLRRQWQSELLHKFFVDDFPDKTLRISAHETAEKWGAYEGFDLVVVDEAHRLVQVDGPGESPYRELKKLAHSVPRLLLLSATPVASCLSTHLGLLHLLDRDLYRWEDGEAFQRRFDLRRNLATAVYALDSDFESLLGEVIDEIADMLPDDPRFRELADEVNTQLTAEGCLRDETQRPELAASVESLRAHISETYRLHRRMIRHRRAQVLRDDDEASTLAFEVRGRTAPEAVIVPAVAHEDAQDALILWQARIMDWLRDGGEEEVAALYGSSLAVLVSRAGGPVGDLADALRWRLYRDHEAARRAGLSDEERASLTASVVAPVESTVLERLEGLDDVAALRSLADALIPILRRHARVVVFCGPGNLAESLCNHLQKRFPQAAVRRHSRQSGAASCESAISLWTQTGGVLVGDDTTEDGLNLQSADAVVHCRLPWSPNRLEQRLGRVDRYVGVDSSRAPAQQFVLSYLDGQDCFSGAWADLLVQGFAIFDGSVSTLQDAIDRQVTGLWSTAMDAGPRSLVTCVDDLRRELAEETRQIDGMDLLESVHESSWDVRDIAASLGRLELDWRDMRQALVGYAGTAEGGLRFFARRLSDEHPDLLRFERGRADPLMPPRVFARAGLGLRPELMQGAFNRTVALRHPGTRLFRNGHPFVDLLASVVTIDDRGQASAFWRRDPRHRGDPEVFFGMDYLVEADIEAALEVAGRTDLAHRAVRHQADQVFEPFVHRVWIPAGQEYVVEADESVEWLNRSYRPAAGDINLNTSRKDDLLAIVGDRGRFTALARQADQVGRIQLRQVSDLTSRCELAQRLARRTLAVRRAQARARQAAGHLVGDAETYLMDTELTEAVLAGLAHPRLRLVSITCLVRSGAGVISRVG